MRDGDDHLVGSAGDTAGAEADIEECACDPRSAITITVKSHILSSPSHVLYPRHERGYELTITGVATIGQHRRKEGGSSKQEAGEHC